MNDALRQAAPLGDLLSAPEKVGDRVSRRQDLLNCGAQYLFVAILGYAGFGFAAGLFGGMAAGAMAAVKAPAIALTAFLLCLPSLYVFSRLGGSPLAGTQLVVLGLGCLALTGLLLAAFAPVVWLFAVSTASLPFVVVLDLLAWSVGIAFAVRFTRSVHPSAPGQLIGGLRFWLLILAVTGLQMTTCLRPILVGPGEKWRNPEKQFFLQHFSACFAPKPGAR